MKLGAVGPTHVPGNQNLLRREAKREVQDTQLEIILLGEEAPIGSGACPIPLGWEIPT